MHRLYIDETGNADLWASKDPNHRYLSLTGIMMHLNVARDAAKPLIEDLKQNILEPDPDETIILHRKEIIKSKPPFQALRDPAKRAAFDKELLRIIYELDYLVITAVIDKFQHLKKYSVWHHDPYHYCLEVLLERYVLWLRDMGSRGDVIAERRGKKEDMRLRNCFAYFYNNGTRHVNSTAIQGRLTSKHIKMEEKQRNIAGLQLADMIAYPSYTYVRDYYSGKSAAKTFARQIQRALLENKYRRGPSGKIPGYGIKMLP